MYLYIFTSAFTTSIGISKVFLPKIAHTLSTMLPEGLFCTTALCSDQNDSEDRNHI